MSTKEEKDFLAREYAEKYGVIEYKVIGKWLIYYANYPKYLAEPRKTYKVMYNIRTGEEKRILLKRWNRKGNANMYL